MIKIKVLLFKLDKCKIFKVYEKECFNLNYYVNFNDDEFKFLYCGFNFYVLKELCICFFYYLCLK